MSLLHLIFFLIVLVVCGLLPVYFITSNCVVSRRSRIIFSIGFAPAWLGVLNSINVLLGIQDGFLGFTIPIIIDLYFIGSRYLGFASNQASFSLPKNPRIELTTLATGVLFGFVYWLLAFHSYKEAGILYKDVIWNLGIVGELKNHFPPRDPHWYTGNYMVYHFLTNMYIAGMSNLTGFNAVTTMHLVNLVTAVGLFAVLSALLPHKGLLGNLIVFLLVCFASFASDWIPFDGLRLHMTGYAASTFYWSLPILFGSIHLWGLVNDNREKISHLSFLSISLGITGVIFFSKASFILVFLCLELYSFFQFAIRHKLWNPKNLKANAHASIEFLYYPGLFFIFLWIFSNGAQGMFFGIESRDFGFFKSWNPIYPILALYTTTVIMIVINLRRLGGFRWELLITSIVNIALFFAFKHPGYSDMYFAFAAVLMNAFFLASARIRGKLEQYITTVFLAGSFFFYLANQEKVDGLNQISFDFEKFANTPVYGDSVNVPEVSCMMELSRQLPANALIVAPKSEDVKFFKYSAFLGRRIWNENDVYRFDGYSENYYPIYQLYLSQSFWPEDLPKRPTNESFGEALKVFKGKIMFDTVQFKDSKVRYELYDKMVFGSSTNDDNDSIANYYGWTHFLVLQRDASRVNDWIKSLEKIDCPNFTLYACSGNY